MANKLTTMQHLPVTNGGAGDGTAGSKQISSAGSSASAILPTNAAGAKPTSVWVQAAGTGYFRLTIGTGTAVVHDLMLTSGQGVKLLVGAFTYANWISSTGTILCNVTALED